MNEILRELDLESREFSGVFESLIGSAKKQGSLIDRFLLHYETFNPFYKNILLKSTQPVNNKEEATPQNTIPIEETPSPEKQSNTKGLQKGKKKKGGKSVEPKQEIIEQPAKASPAKKQEMEIETTKEEPKATKGGKNNKKNSKLAKNSKKIAKTEKASPASNKKNAKGKQKEETKEMEEEPKVEETKQKEEPAIKKKGGKNQEKNSMNQMEEELDQILGIPSNVEKKSSSLEMIVESSKEANAKKNDMVVERENKIDMRTLRRMKFREEDSILKYPNESDPSCIEIKYHDLLKLAPFEYLNDTIIDFYLKFIQNELLSEDRKKKVHIVSTYFLTKLDQYTKKNGPADAYDKMKRWAKKVDWFHQDFIVFPLNENEHWSILILCFPARLYDQTTDKFPVIVMFDSLGVMNSEYASEIEYFVKHLLNEKKPDLYAKFEEKMKATPGRKVAVDTYQPMVVKQHNLSDCGLYLLQYAELFVDDETYILEGYEKGDLQRLGWFPRSIVLNKRQELLQLIWDLKNKEPECGKRYKQERNNRISKLKDDPDEYDKFDEDKFRKVLSKHNLKVPDDQMKLMKLFIYQNNYELDPQQFEMFVDKSAA